MYQNTHGTWNSSQTFSDILLRLTDLFKSSHNETIYLFDISCLLLENQSCVGQSKILLASVILSVTTIIINKIMLF